MAEFENKDIQRIQDEFEQQWQQGLVPNLSEQQSRLDDKVFDKLLASLLKIDQKYRHQHSLQCDAEFYKTMLPDHAKVVDSVLGPTSQNNISQQFGAKGDISTLYPPDQPLKTNRDGSRDHWSNSPAKKLTSKRIGPYKLLQKIGEGGMGSVWMAQQEKPIRRRVALKLIKSEFASDEIVARFEAERQAIAMMNHLNIASVLDAGTADNGSPYFVMELVKGIPITRYCDDHRLSIKKRLELFIPVCKAVQHAHQKGVIHRDLKPSNVLVSLHDSEPVPKVIDFGLAKAMDHTQQLTDKTMFTEFGKIVGTIQYMSPEQAELNQLDVDTRTDIYSLGVMLYELLTGSTPLDKESMGRNALLQVLKLIRELEPQRPSDRLSSFGEAIKAISQQRKISPAKLHQVLRGELDWVVMKALEKDRTRRYETANGLAADIARHLDNEPVLARPPSINYRLRKFVSKNKRLVGTAVSITAVALAGFVLIVSAVSVSLFSDVMGEKTTEAAVSRKRAVEAEKSVKRAEDILKILSASFDSLSSQPGANANTSTNDTILQAKEHLDSYWAVRNEDAAIAWEQELEQRTAMLGADHPSTLAAMHNLATSYAMTGRNEEAVLLFQETLKLRKASLGADDFQTRNTVNSLVWAIVANAAHSNKLSDGLLDEMRRASNSNNSHAGPWKNTLAVAEYRRGNFEEAINAAIHSNKKTRNPAYLPYRAINLAVIAMSNFKMGNAEIAEEFRKKFDESMKLDHYKNEKSCISFGEEVQELFGAGDNKTRTDKDTSG